MLRFNENELVGLREDMPLLNTKAGTVGVVRVLYGGGASAEDWAYEVEWSNEDGEVYSMPMLASEIVRLSEANSDGVGSE